MQGVHKRFTWGAPVGDLYYPRVASILSIDSIVWNGCETGNIMWLL